MIPSFLLLFIAGVPLFTMSAISLASMQLNMLAFELQRIFKHLDAENNVNNQEIRRRIVKCSKHHSLIFSFRSLLNQTFSTVMVLYTALMILVLCIGLYALFALDKMEDILRTLAYVAIFNYEFFACYCLPSQELTDLSISLTQSLYFTEWYQFPKLYKTIFLLFGQLRMTATFNVRGIASFGYETGMKVGVNNCYNTD
nr:unnamed protein product [Callosobruchus chinensis]